MIVIEKQAANHLAHLGAAGISAFGDGAARAAQPMGQQAALRGLAHAVQPVE